MDVGMQWKRSICNDPRDMVELRQIVNVNLPVTSSAKEMIDLTVTYVSHTGIFLLWSKRVTQIEQRTISTGRGWTGCRSQTTICPERVPLPAVL